MFAKPTCCRTLTFSSLCLKNKKTSLRMSFNFSGGGTEIRTLDPMIKSHLLYQLSYASKTELFHKVRGTFCHKKNNKSRKKYKFVKNILYIKKTPAGTGVEKQEFFTLFCISIVDSHIMPDGNSRRPGRRTHIRPRNQTHPLRCRGKRPSPDARKKITSQ